MYPSNKIPKREKKERQNNNEGRFLTVPDSARSIPKKSHSEYEHEKKFILSQTSPQIWYKSQLETQSSRAPNNLKLDDVINPFSGYSALSGDRKPRTLKMEGDLLPFEDEIVYQMAQVNLSASEYMSETYGKTYPRLYEINDMMKQQIYPTAETSEEAKIFLIANTRFLLSRKVTALDLSYMGLNSLPDWFHTIVLSQSKLLEINLSNNNLKTLPSTFCHFTQITSLNLENNELTYLPQCMNKMQALQYLNVRRNQLRYLPQTMANMTNLHVLLIKGKGNYINMNKLPKIPNLAVLD